MLTVWSMCTGDKYPIEYVAALRLSVHKYITIPYRFVCITEHNIDGITTIAPPTDYHGWFGKIGLFKPGLSSGVNLWLDLDVVITSHLDGMINDYSSCDLSCAKNWAQSGHGGCQSSVMIWKGGDSAPAEIIYKLFDSSMIDSFYGDQEWITQLRDNRILNVTHFDESLIKSYKYHCRLDIPNGCKIISFHGKPDPHEVKDKWILPFTQTLISNIKSGQQRDL